MSVAVPHGRGNTAGQEMNEVGSYWPSMLSDETSYPINCRTLKRFLAVHRVRQGSWERVTRL